MHYEGYFFLVAADFSNYTLLKATWNLVCIPCEHAPAGKQEDVWLAKLWPSEKTYGNMKLDIASLIIFFLVDFFVFSWNIVGMSHFVNLKIYSFFKK